MSTGRYIAFVIAGAAVLLLTGASRAPIDADDVFSIDSPTGDIVCGLVDDTYVPGRLGSENDETSFRSFSQLIASIRQRLSKLSGAKLTKARKQMKSFTGLRRAQESTCRSGPPGGGGSNPPTGFPTAVPTFGGPPFFAPTPTPGLGPPAVGPDRNLTTQAKVLLGVPVALQANVDRGAAVHAQFNCNGCHDTRLFYTFTSLRTNIARPPMFYTSALVPDQQLADLTAFLNEGRRLPQ
jgi:hypothetical protein